MKTVPHGSVSRRRNDEVWEGIGELLELGLIRWTCDHISPEDWPNDQPLPVVFTEQANSIPREG